MALGGVARHQAMSSAWWAAREHRLIRRTDLVRI